MASKTPVIVATWAFAPKSVEVATRLADEGMACEACLEKALNVVEEDAKYGPYQVGKGGPPNKNGEVELDAAIMSGRNLRFGAVTALQGISRASSVARYVMEKSPHSMLTAQGAQDFALQCGFQLDISPAQISSGDASGGTDERRRMADTMHGQASNQHDTLGLIVLDSQGNIAAGVTTSGMKDKARGRIGDSALPGCGLYADNDVGAVVCSGEGDEIMKFCPSFLVMENMRQGMSPHAACQAAVRRIQQRIAPSPVFELAIIAVNMKGEVGAASTVKEWTLLDKSDTFPGFPFITGRVTEHGVVETEVTSVLPVS